MSKEVTIENEMRDTIKVRYAEGGLLYQGEIIAHSILGPALKGVSGPGYGQPEAAVFSDQSFGSCLALVECKKSGPGQLRLAVQEAQEYVTHVNANGFSCPLAIAFAGGTEFSISRYTRDGFKACKRENGAEFTAFPSMEELAALAATKDGQLMPRIAAIDEHKLGHFFVKVNEIFQSCHITEALDRVLLFTALLVACKSEDFRSIVENPGKRKAIGLAGAVTSAIKQLLDADAIRHQDGAEFERDLNGFASLVEIELASANSQNAIGQIILKGIPEFIVKNGMTIKDFLAGLDESAFKIVDVYEVFHTYAPSNDLGQYFTPRHMVRAIIRIVELFRGTSLTTDDIAYDPACGVGGFLVGVLEQVGANYYGTERDAAKLAMGRNLLGCEPATKVAHIARVNLWMHGDGTSGIYQGDPGNGSLERRYTLAYAKAPDESKPGDVGLDTCLENEYPAGKPHPFSSVLLRNCQGRFPTIALLNPPFPEHKKAYQAFEFIEHALRSLGKEGWLAAIVPATTVISDDKEHAAFRTRMLRYAQLEAVIALPNDLFQPSASVNPYLIILQKNGGHRLNKPVFFARCLTDGFAMNKAVKRRLEPKDSSDRIAKDWDPLLRVGGDVAKILKIDIPAHLVGAINSRP